MSDKPRVYGFCDAGCRWRVPHYSEFESAAAFIDATSKVVNEGFELGKTYKIISGANATQWDFSIIVANKDWQMGDATIYAPIFQPPLLCPTFDEYTPFVKFRPLAVKLDGSALSVIYELNGERLTMPCSSSASGLAEDDAYFKFELATDSEASVYLWNEDAHFEIDVEGKVDKVSNVNRIYGTDSNGNQTTYAKGPSEAWGSETVVMRVASGNILVPENPDGIEWDLRPRCAVSKKYVDDAIANATGGGAAAFTPVVYDRTACVSAVSGGNVVLDIPKGAKRAFIKASAAKTGEMRIQGTGGWVNVESLEMGYAADLAVVVDLFPFDETRYYVVCTHVAAAQGGASWKYDTYGGFGINIQSQLIFTDMNFSGNYGNVQVTFYG